MNKYLKITAAATAVALLSGCAMTRESLPLNYKLPAANAGLKSSKHQKLTVSVQDVRDIDDARLIMHKENMDGDTAVGGYLAEKSIAAIVKGALVQGLKQMHYRVGPKGKYAIDCEIMSIKPTYVVGWVSSDDGVKINLNVRVYNQATHALIWQDIIMGRSSIKTAWADDTRKEFNLALTDAVRRLQKSQGLYQALNG